MDAVVSLLDPGDDVPPAVEALGVPVLPLVFHDTDGDDLDVLPEIWHLIRLARFLDEVRAAALHVHCFAGISRSPALASFVLGHLHPEWSDTQVVEAVLAVRPQAVPNAHLLGLADARLGRCLTRAWTAQNRY